MHNFNFALWLPIASALLGAILHSLSDDGGASILAHFKIDRRPPAWLLPFAIALIGFASGAVDELAGGADLQHAFATALMATITSVFGAVAHHSWTTGKAPPGAATVVALAMAVTLGGCAAFAHEARQVTADLALCLAQQQNLPDEQAFLACGVQEAEKELAKELLGEARRQSARAAAQAAERERHEAELRAGCGGYRDGGAR